MYCVTLHCAYTCNAKVYLQKLFWVERVRVCEHFQVQNTCEHLHEAKPGVHSGTDDDQNGLLSEAGKFAFS